MHGKSPLQIREIKSGGSVSAVGRAEQIEQGSILRDGQRLPVAERPIYRRKIAREHPNLTYIWIRHRDLLPGKT
jgi:hypothetical protein